MAYNKPWQVERSTQYYGADDMGNIMERQAQDNRDPLEILIEAEEEEQDFALLTN